MSLVGRNPEDIIEENQTKEHHYPEKQVQKIEQLELYLSKITGKLELD